MSKNNIMACCTKVKKKLFRSEFFNRKIRLKINNKNRRVEAFKIKLTIVTSYCSSLVFTADW